MHTLTLFHRTSLCLTELDLGQSCAGNNGNCKSGTTCDTGDVCSEYCTYHTKDNCISRVTPLSVCFIVVLHSYILLSIPLSVFPFVAFSFHNRSLSWLLFFSGARVEGGGGCVDLVFLILHWFGLFNKCLQLFSYLFYPPFSKDRT